MKSLIHVMGAATGMALGICAVAQTVPSSSEAAAADQVAQSKKICASFVSQYAQLAQANDQKSSLDMIMRAIDQQRSSESAAQGDAFALNGTRYAIRIYQYYAPDAPRPRANPAIRWDGVIGGDVIPVMGYEPEPPGPSTAPKPAAPASPPQRPETPAAKPAPQPPQPATPSLDDLLGLKPKPSGAAPTGPTPSKDGTPAVADVAPDQSKADLDRLLTAQEMGDALKQAIALMGDASTRLNEHNDPGLGTQRVQEDVVKRLDQLLASLDKQQQQQQSSSPQKSEPKQQPGQKKPQSQQGQQQQQPQQGDGMQAHDGPTLQQGQLKPELESARAAWGSLPARIRDMLMQGTEDRFSARYKAMTQEYYKRLAEENSK